VSPARVPADDKVDRRTLILDSVLRLLSTEGISGVSTRAVAREAGVASGLVHYYFDDKTSLIAAALRRVEEQDLSIVQADAGQPPERRLRTALRRVADPQFLTTEYLSLRMQLWALARVNPDFAEINTAAQARYRAGLAALIRAARPDLSRADCDRRAADIDVIQNGLWLTALLGLDRTSIRRTVARTEEIALAG
jgi:TetR/AcrR family transcriptional regulator, cholesterol catabolism regulator